MININKGQLFWENYFHVYDSLNKVLPYQKLIAQIFEEIKPGKNDLILDAGAGTGNLSVKMESNGARVVALDYSSEALAILRTKSKTIQTIVHDLRKSLPFPDNYFSKIVCNNTLYALRATDIPRTVSEFYRVLQSKGVIIISNPLKGAKPINILKNHFKEANMQWGWGNAVFDMIRYVVNAVKLLYYNHLIVRRAKVGQYHFFEDGEQAELIKNAGMFVEKVTKVYSDQNEMVIAKK